ncbi:MAG: T9SS type A sorting domain-containing protein [Flavobacteriales bacterium]
MFNPSTLLLPCLLWATTHFAQITITSNDLPSVGDNLQYRQAATTGVQTSSTGANSNWNYSNLLGNGQLNEEFLPLTATDFVYAIFFSTPLSPNQANLAKKENFPIPIPPQTGVTLEDPYAFYRKRNGDFAQVGLGVKIQNFPVPVAYNPADFIYRFPLQFGNRDTSNFAYNIDIPTLGYYGRKGRRVNHVDGWGTLSLPGGATYNCLRVKSTVTATDSIQLDTLGFGFNLPIPTEVKYKWLAPGHAWPVLEITATQLFTFDQITRVIYFQSNVASLNDLTSEHLSVYPNPAQNMIFVKIDHVNFRPTHYNIIDLMGKTVLRRNIIPNETFVIDDLPSGMQGVYLLSFSDGERTVTKKFTKLTD